MKSESSGAPVGAALGSGVQQTERQRSRHPLQLDADEGSNKALHHARGNDPYNTSGSFDRKKNWARVGKR